VRTETRVGRRIPERNRLPGRKLSPHELEAARCPGLVPDYDGVAGEETALPQPGVPCFGGPGDEENGLSRGEGRPHTGHLAAIDVGEDARAGVPEREAKVGGEGSDPDEERSPNDARGAD
jgi:hypothetical protein